MMMSSDDHDPPTFKTSITSGVEFAKVKRKVIELQSIADLPSERQILYTLGPRLSAIRFFHYRSRLLSHVYCFVGPPGNEFTTAFGLGTELSGDSHHC